jgi:hypothetical protein
MRQRLSFIALLFVPAAAHGQYYGGYGYSYHSSTLEEGVQRGAADIVRSYGLANLLSSQGAKEFEAARSQYLDNEYKATTNYFEVRRYSAEQRRANDTRPLSMEQWSNTSGWPSNRHPNNSRPRSSIRLPAASTGPLRCENLSTTPSAAISNGFFKTERPAMPPMAKSRRLARRS